MPPSLEGELEAEVWERTIGQYRSFPRGFVETLAAYCRAVVDEGQAREEMQTAMKAGDPNAARAYGVIVRDMRGQAAKFLADLSPNPKGPR